MHCCCCRCLFTANNQASESMARPLHPLVMHHDASSMHHIPSVIDNVVAHLQYLPHGSCGLEATLPCPWSCNMTMSCTGY